MATKKKTAKQAGFVPLPGETVIKTPRGAAVGVAIRTSETETEFRMLITIRAGFDPGKIVFNFGNYGGGGAQMLGGDPGTQPCP